MQFGIIPPVRLGVTADPAWMTSFARHAEACGFESVVLVEHAVVISDYRSTYPYAASGKMPLPDDCRIPDPLDLMAYLAAVTDRITLATGVLVAPNHQAVVLAKRIATVDVLSAGRVRMCVGVGWMDEELAATGADPRTRGRRTDETIAAMRALWADAGASGADFDGEFVSFHHAHSFPKPFRPGGVPLHIGGHSEAAARRAGRLGDGFQPLGLDADVLATRLGQIREAAEGAGRDPDAIELSLSGYLPTTHRGRGGGRRGGRCRPPGGVHLDDRGPGRDPATRCRPSPIGSGCAGRDVARRDRWPTPGRTDAPSTSAVVGLRRRADARDGAGLASLFTERRRAGGAGAPDRPPPGRDPLGARRAVRGGCPARPLPPDPPRGGQRPVRGGR